MQIAVQYVDLQLQICVIHKHLVNFMDPAALIYLLCGISGYIHIFR